MVTQVWADLPILVLYTATLATSVVHGAAISPAKGLRTSYVGSLICSLALVCAAYGWLPIGNCIPSMIRDKRELLSEALVSPKVLT